MTKKVDAMIQELVHLIEKELGLTLPGDSAHRVKEALCRQYGGERLYAPKLPKLIHQVRMTALGTAESTSALAGAMGLTVRRIQQLKRGR